MGLMVSGVRPPLRALEPVSTCDRIITSLKDAFFSGQFRPGDAIVERRLADELGVGTPPVREALVILQEQGFVNRVANKATYVTRYTPEEARQAFALRVELELTAFRWAKPLATPEQLDELDRRVESLVAAGKAGEARRFLELDLELHGACWQLSGNRYLAETLHRHMAPLSVFVILASGFKPTGEMAREHYHLVRALRELEEPAFSHEVRRTLTHFADHWPTVIPAQQGTM